MHFSAFINDISLAVLDEFAGLLSEEKCSVEDFAVWVDNIIDKCFKKVIICVCVCVGGWVGVVIGEHLQSNYIHGVYIILLQNNGV